ncbi:Ligand-dependent corepressor [Chelonia mydas]|uniref:Ligand-dependent corepressor n=1 Tax=Chelonia mydas TaxID=8469 RepID=M7AXX6_CHEMY|nr:Ligand-dependent corepressor [Chelonia mydas]
MQRMIRQFAAEYTSKNSSTQDSSQPNSTKNQSLLKASLVASSPTAATAQNPVLSKLLMADQDSPLDLTVRKSQSEPSEQENSAFQKMALHTKQDGKKDVSHSSPVDLKIPQVRGMDLSWESRTGDQYSYSSLVMGSQTESALSKKLRAILPKQNRRSLLDAGPDSWGSDAEQSTSGQPYPTSDQEGDPGSKQPRKKRGRYRQYNSEILEEAISVVMSGKMSVSKAQSIYGIPHSTLEYKVKERLGTLKNPPKKKMKLMRSEGQDVSIKMELDPQGETAQSANESKDE